MSADSEHESINSLGVLAAAVAVSAWGLSGVIAKDIDMSGIAIGAYRFMAYGLVVGLIMTARGSRFSLHAMRKSFLGGLALGIDVAFFFTAVKLTTVANATVIGALQPVVVTITAARMFGERVARRDVLLGALALAGVITVVLAARGSEEWSPLGDLLALGALFAWSAYFIFAKRAKEEITSTEYTVGAALWCGLINFPLGFVFGQDMGWPSSSSWVGLLVLAFGAGLLGHEMMNWSIQQIPLWISSTLTLLIPVVSASAAWIFLDESLRPIQVVAMGVVLVALGGIVARQTGIGARPRPLRR